MPLVLTEEQSMLKDSARAFLASRAPVSHLRALRDGGNSSGFSRELWGRMTEMGWAAALVPETYGGVGYGVAEMAIILQECGRTLAPSPLLSSAMIGVAALMRAGSESQRDSMLPGIAAGQHLLALAVDEQKRHAPHSVGCTATATNGGFQLHGRKHAVMDGHVAHTLIVSAATGSNDETTLFLVPANADGIRIHPLELFDTHHGADIDFDSVFLSDDAVLGAPGAGAETLDYLLDVGRIGQSAELLGIAEETFDRTVNYLKERRQFGVPIGSFQGLQHRAAILFGEIEMCRSAVLHASRSLDAGCENVARIASMTKAKLAETAHTACTEAIQMHGGVGMTDEFDIGFFLKRCQIIETVYGDRYYHLDRFAALSGY